jgi:hypothetical protein
MSNTTFIQFSNFVFLILSILIFGSTIGLTITMNEDKIKLFFNKINKKIF